MWKAGVKTGNDGWNEKVRSREFTPFMLRTNSWNANLWAEIKASFLHLQLEGKGTGAANRKAPLTTS